MTTDLVKSQDYRLALEPRSFTEVRDIAKMASRIGMCGVKTEEDGVLRILFGREVGFTAMQALRLVSVINGRPSVDATAVVGRCLQHPDCEYFELVESSATRAAWKTKRKGRPEMTIPWTIEQAQKARLDTKDNWKMWPENMLRARAATTLARIVWPEVTAGLYTADELSHGVIEIRDGEVVHVEPPVAEPVLVQSEVIIEQTVRDIALDFLADLDGARNPDELSAVAAKIKNAKLAPAVRKSLVDAYRRKASALETAALAADAPAPSDADEDAGA